MAKSLRSKWKRARRAELRDKYSKRELERLKSIVGKAQKADIDMKELVTVVKTPITKAVVTKENDMEVDGTPDSERRTTLRDKHGTFPVWMNRRQKHKAIVSYKAGKRTIRKPKKVGQKKEPSPWSKSV